MRPLHSLPALLALVTSLHAAPSRGDLPPERFVDWHRASITFPDTSWDTVEVSTLGINPGNVLTDGIAAKFVAALAAQGTAKRVYHFAEGTYTFEAPICIGPNGLKDTWAVTGADVNNVVIMGDGPDKTHFLFDCDVTYFKALIWVEKPAGYSARNAAVSLASAPAAGTSVLTMPAGAPAFKVGDLVDVKSNNDTNLMFPIQDTSEAWFKKFNNAADLSEGGNYAVDFAESFGQVSEITAVNGSDVTIDPPLALSYTSELNPRVSVFASKNRNENIGVQDLSIEHVIDDSRYTSFGTNDIFDIAFRFTRNCFVKNVSSRNTARGHVIVEYSHNVLVTDSKFAFARRYGTGGAGYGVCIQNRSSEVTVENNEFEHLRHAVVLKEGANHCVIGYNWTHNWAILDSTVVDSAGNMIQAEADMSIHGMYSHSNLFEGNVCYNISYADYWGPTGPRTTSFRNRCYTVDSARCGIKVHDFSHTANLIANIVPAIGILRVDTSCHDAYTEGNVLSGTAQWNTLSSLSTIPPSLYLTSAPPFWTTATAWPPFGPDVAGAESNTIPAMGDSGATGIISSQKSLSGTTALIVRQNATGLVITGTGAGNAEHLTAAVFNLSGRKLAERAGSLRNGLMVPTIAFSNGLYVLQVKGMKGTLFERTFTIR